MVFDGRAERSMAQEHVFDLIPGYALGSLDEDELLQVARHLPHCAICRNELSTFWDTADQIALAMPLRTPSPDLRQKILNRVERSYSTTAAPDAAHRAAAATRQQPEPRGEPGLLGWLRGLLARPAGLAWSAAALLLIVALGISNLTLWQQIRGIQAREAQRNMDLVWLRGEETAPEAHGYLMVFKEENYGTLVVEDAPLLEQGKQYQLWLIRDGERTSGGVFSVSEQGYGVLEVNSSLPLDSYSSFGITVEPEGGSLGPTGQKILGGDL